MRKFNINLDVEYKSLPMPRENDECIMERLLSEGVLGQELISINRAQKHQEAIFLSDIFMKNGLKIGPIYICLAGKNRSKAN